MSDFKVDDKLTFHDLNKIREDNEAQEIEDSLKKIDANLNCGCYVIGDEIYSFECKQHNFGKGAFLDAYNERKNMVYEFTDTEIKERDLIINELKLIKKMQQNRLGSLKK